MKTMLLILFLILPASVIAQALKPRVVEPIRVEITAQGDPDLRPLILSQLRKRRGVVVVMAKGDFDVRLIVSKDAECNRFVVATVVVTRSTGRFGISLDTASDLKEIAERVTAKLGADFLAPEGK